MKRNDYLNPKEIKDGFYQIPMFENYVINKEGVVKNKTTWKTLLANSNKGNYLQVCIGIQIDKNKPLVYKSCFVHRLMAITFLYADEDIRNLQVNHKDANLSNNKLENLEWCTPSENIHHAVNIGRAPKPVPVQARNAITGEILYFDTRISCGRHFNLNRDQIQYRINCGPLRIFPEGYQYRIDNFDQVWPVPNAYDEEDKHSKTIKKEFGTSKSILVKEWKKEGLITKFDQAQKAADYLGISPSTLSEYLSYDNQPVFSGLVQVKYDVDDTPWREITDPWLELVNSTRPRKVVKVINDSTKEIRLYETPLECAKAIGIRPTTLDWRLKTQGTKVYNDGCRYGYYPYD